MGNCKDIVGQRFGNLLVLRKGERPTHLKNRCVYWYCKCDCGNEVLVSGGDLRRGNTTSCGCKNYKTKNHLDLSNRKFGLLTAVDLNHEYGEKKRLEGKEKHCYWNCICECGNTIIVSSDSLLNGKRLSCGCIKSYGESQIKKILDNHNILYEYDHPFFKDLKTPKNSIARYDFILLNEKNEPYYIIEFDGEQHNEIVSSWGDEEGLKYRQEVDKIKNNYAKKIGIPLARIPYTERDNLTFELLFEERFIYKGE